MGCILCLRDFPGKNSGVGCHSLPQGIFRTQGSNLCLPHCKWSLYRLSHQGSSWRGRWYWILPTEMQPLPLLHLMGWGRATSESFLLLEDVHLFTFHSKCAEEVPWLQKWKKQMYIQRSHHGDNPKKGKTDQYIIQCDMECFKNILYSEACICCLGFT